jgi:CheY-like chemotaxis protein
MKPGRGSLTIMVIDDDEMVRDAVVDLLLVDGHRVLVAANGEAALAILRVLRPDLILVDLTLAGVSLSSRSPSSRSRFGN